MEHDQPYLVVQAQIDPSVLDEFERWLREVHFDSVMRIPGVVAARRCYHPKGRPNYSSIFKLENDSAIRTALASEEAGIARAQWNRWILYVEDGSLQVSVYATLEAQVALYQHN